MAGGVAGQGLEQPVGVGEGFGGGPALDAEGALVDGEGGVAGDDGGVAGAGEGHAALEGAVGAVGCRRGC